MSQHDQRDREDWMAAAEAREWIRGNKPERAEPEAHTGLVGDDLVRRLLTLFKQVYSPERAARLYDGLEPEDMPPRAEETKLYQRLVSIESTETLTRSIHNGDVQTQSFAVGDPAARSDISGLNAISRLTEMLIHEAPIIYIFGEPGAGKTNFSLLLAQLWKREHPEGELASNIRTWEEADRWVPRFGALDDWTAENVTTENGVQVAAEDADPKLFVFDEASSHASGRGEQGHEAGQKLGPLVYKIRKSQCGLIIIGHDGKDVHPAVRTLATVVQRYRENQKKATVYEDVRDRQGRGKIMGLSGIPQTDFTYDDKEATAWSWDDSDEGEPEEDTLEQARELAEDMAEEQLYQLAYTLATADYLDVRQNDIGRALGEAHRGEPFSQQWVTKHKKRIERDLAETEGAVEIEDDEDE